MTSLLANVAISILFPQPLFMLVALLPVVAVETLTLRRQFDITGKQVFAANLVSTLFGLPLAYLCIVLFNVVLTGGDSYWWSAGLRTRFASDALHHIVTFPTAMVCVLVPCFVLSVWIEGQFYTSYCIGIVADKRFWSGIVRAHFLSYLVLVVIDVLWLRSRLV